MVAISYLDAKESVTVSDAVFNVDFKEALIHQAITTYLTNARLGTRAQKNRSAVRGGGSKPWRQKGTGRARAGTIRSPIWRGGGVTFAAQPKEYDKKLNKKMYKLALRSILSELVRQERLVVLKSLEVKTPKTRDFVKQLESFGEFKKLLIVVDDLDKNLVLAAQNLYYVELCQTKQLTPVNLVGSDKIIITSTALKNLEESLA